MTQESMLAIDDLHVSFGMPRGVVEVINGVSLAVGDREMHGIVGESGSGKSVTARAVLGLLPRSRIREIGGTINYRGQNLLDLDEKTMRNEIRGKEISMVFQDPMTALHPTMRIGRQIMIPIRRHTGVSRAQARTRALELLEDVGIPDPVRRLRSYPHELSGGQRQRVMIAIALSCEPSLLIADEPTTALDVTVQAQILDLFTRLRRERGLAIVLVSHDLTLIAERCDDVSVMYAGRVIERGDAKSIFTTPRHPYTRLLEEARPRLESEPHTTLQTIPGSVPNLTLLPAGCAFEERCPRADEVCAASRPEVITIASSSVACFHPQSAEHPLGAAEPTISEGQTA